MPLHSRAGTGKACRALAMNPRRLPGEPQGGGGREIVGIRTKGISQNPGPGSPQCSRRRRPVESCRELAGSQVPSSSPICFSPHRDSHHMTGSPSAKQNTDAQVPWLWDRVATSRMGLSCVLIFSYQSAVE